MDTGDKSRDATMHYDHMESAKYPDIGFTLFRMEQAATAPIASSN